MKHKNKRENFFVWYYEGGLHGFLEIWKNFLFFVWTRFSIVELLETLFFPWKKDVEIKDWRGWNPKKAFNLVLDNLFSRLIGGVVRLCVITFGSFLFVAFFVGGFLLLLFWIVSPAAVFFFAYKAFSGSLVFMGASVVSFLFLIVAVKAYFLDTRRSLYGLGLKDLYGEKIFERICNRLGITRRSFPKSVLKNPESLENFLVEKGLSREDLSGIIDREAGLVEEKISKEAFWRRENLEKFPKIGSQWRYSYTVRLDNYSSDLSISDNSEYSERKLEGRNDELDLLKLILQRPDQNCAIISGGTGIGKSTLVHSLAESIRRGKAETFFQNKRILLLDLGRAISDFVSRGADVEGEVRKLFAEASYSGNVILFIEHFEHFLGKKTGTYHPDLAPVMGEFLAHPNFQIIGTSSTKEYHNLIEKHEELLKYFEVIEMREPTENETMEIIYSILKPYETNRVIFTHEAIKSAIKESNRYNWSSPLPERAIDLVMDVMMFWHSRPESVFITSQTVSDFLSLKTGTPHGEVKVSERKKLLNLEKILHKQVIGQEEAIEQVAEALRRARSGIGNSQKPVGSFLFLGPTGVGKTETAKALAKTYFGDEERMIRIDMSEFQNPSSIDRLIGSSQLNQQGRLTTMVKDNPYSLILLDEIEKAYPDILDIFLQILDEGFVTDAFGEKINFRNTMIVATSNAGASLIKSGVENNMDAEIIKKELIDYAIENNIFKVEFLNRFDGVIFFRPLQGGEISSVVRLMLAKLGRRISEEKNIEMEFSEDIIGEIIQNGYNPIFGARSLNRYIEETVENILAKKIIAGEVKKGEKVKISL